ncbi:MAG: NAD(P)(+) transhydrogenase (Re/Si-specific) subunit beta, partial [Halobacteria archaeon]|nr:NAD(P)(+) transhydrogenase (Re/Si-specific) subunit beta [Halobacteria archaeon]
MALAGLPDWILSMTYLVSAILFIQGLRDMTHPRTAMRGNLLSSGGMLLAVGITVMWFEIVSPVVLIGGLVIGSAIGLGLAVKVERTEMPQLVGVFNGFGGGASAVVAGATLIEIQGSIPVDTAVAGGISGIIGAVTFFGSMV